jgi:tetratricopeptide (TPR) repeat protein
MILKTRFRSAVLIFLSGVLFMACQQKNELPDFDKLWNYNDPVSTSKSFIEIKEKIDSEELPYDQDYYAQLITQIARTKGLQSQFNEAHALLDSTESLIMDKYPVSKIRYLLERGRVYNSSGNPKAAVPIFLEAWEWGLDNKLDIYAIDAAHMLGIADVPESRLDWNLKALELTEKTEDKKAKGWLGSLYNNIGWTYHDMEDYEKALDLFQKGLEWRLEIGDTTGARIAKWTVGRTYRSMEKIDDALKIQHELENEIDQKGIAKDGYVYEELGELYLIKLDDEKTKHYFKLAYDNLSEDPWLQNNESKRLVRLKELSE